MPSTPASESALDALVQQHNQHSLIWFSLLWNIAVTTGSLIPAITDDSLVECRRWPLCILELGGLFLFSFFPCDRQAIVHCEYEFAAQCFLSFAALVVNRQLSRELDKEDDWLLQWMEFDTFLRLFYQQCCSPLLLCYMLLCAAVVIRRPWQAPSFSIDLLKLD